MATAINTEITHRTVKFVKFTFTGNVTTTEAETVEFYDGKFLHLVTSPSTALVPAVNWDLKVLDNNGIDILAGSGQNRSSGSTQHLLSSTMGAIAGSRLRFVVANAGATGEGSVYAYIR